MRNTKYLAVVICLLIQMLTVALAAEDDVSSAKIFEAWHILALDLRDEWRYDEAEAVFKGLLQHDPENARATFDLGNVYFAKGDYQRAIHYHLKAGHLGVNVEPSCTYYVNLSRDYAAVGKIRRARYYVQKCLEVEPNADAKGLLEVYGDMDSGRVLIERVDN